MQDRTQSAPKSPPPAAPGGGLGRRCRCFFRRKSRSRRPCWRRRGWPFSVSFAGSFARKSLTKCRSLPSSKIAAEEEAGVIANRVARTTWKTDLHTPLALPLIAGRPPCPPARPSPRRRATPHSVQCRATQSRLPPRTPPAHSGLPVPTNYPACRNSSRHGRARVGYHILGELPANTTIPPDVENPYRHFLRSPGVRISTEQPSVFRTCNTFPI